MTQSERNSVGDANLVSFIQLATGLKSRVFVSLCEPDLVSINKLIDEAKALDRLIGAATR